MLNCSLIVVPCPVEHEKSANVMVLSQVCHNVQLQHHYWADFHRQSRWQRTL